MNQIKIKSSNFLLSGIEEGNTVDCTRLTNLSSSINLLRQRIIIEAISRDIGIGCIACSNLNLASNSCTATNRSNVTRHHTFTSRTTQNDIIIKVSNRIRALTSVWSRYPYEIVCLTAYKVNSTLSCSTTGNGQRSYNITSACLDDIDGITIPTVTIGIHKAIFDSRNCISLERSLHISDDIVFSSADGHNRILSDSSKLAVCINVRSHIFIINSNGSLTILNRVVVSRRENDVRLNRIGLDSVPEDFWLMTFATTIVNTLDTNLVPSAEVHVQIQTVIIDIIIVGKVIRNLRHVFSQILIIGWSQRQLTYRVVYIIVVLIIELACQNRVTRLVFRGNVHWNIGITGSCQCSTGNLGLSGCSRYIRNRDKLNSIKVHIGIIQQPRCIDQHFVRTGHG